MAGGIDFTMNFHTHGGLRKIESADGYRIYVLGNFSGRTELPWEQRPYRKIDVDNFDAIFRQIGPNLALGSGTTLDFESLDEFNPDAWLPKVKLLADLQNLKAQLSNPQTAAQAAAKIQAFFPGAVSPAPQDQPAGESQEQMLERLLGKKPETSEPATDSMEQWIKSMVAPHVTPAPNQEYRALIEVIDTTVSQFVKTLLHSPDFQNLEGLWLATADLVNEAGADACQIFLIDIQQDELRVALQEPAQVFRQKLLKHIQTGDGEQELLLVGDYAFTDTDLAWLQACAGLAQDCGGLFLAGADQSLIQNHIAADAEGWTQFRRYQAARHLILSYPRVLLRMPYGAKRRPLESLAFEECAAIPQPQELQWGNSGFFCARSLMRAAVDLAAPDPGFFAEVPAFSYQIDGEPILQAGVEQTLTENQANALRDKGIMPVIGFRQRQGVRLLGASPIAG